MSRVRQNVTSDKTEHSLRWICYNRYSIFPGSGRSFLLDLVSVSWCDHKMGVTLLVHFVFYLSRPTFPFCRSWRRARTRTKLWTLASTKTSTGARHRRSPPTKRATSRVCTASITVRKRWTCPRPFDWPRGYTPWTASKSLTSLDILAKSTRALRFVNHFVTCGRDGLDL